MQARQFVKQQLEALGAAPGTWNQAYQPDRIENPDPVPVFAGRVPVGKQGDGDRCFIFTQSAIPRQFTLDIADSHLEYFSIECRSGDPEEANRMADAVVEALLSQLTHLLAKNEVPDDPDQQRLKYHTYQVEVGIAHATTR